MTTQHAFFRALCAAVALALIAFAALACGQSRTSFTRKLAAQPAFVNMDEAFAELDALAAPAGVDAGLFAQLKSSFKGRLTARGKIVLTPSAYAINDLDLIPGTGGAMPRITWSSDFFVGDGNIDGAVAISDITPIAMWFNASVASSPGARVADYNRDGTVGISDLTPLAMTFGQRAADFVIETGPTATGPFTERAVLSWSSLLPDKNANGFAVFEYVLAAADFGGQAGAWVRAVPRDADSVEGEPSNAQFAAYPNIAPTAMLGGTPASGQAPLEVVFDATGSSDADGTITKYDYDWESDGTYDLLDGGTAPSHIYSTEGDYSATLRVTDNLGATGTASLPISVTPPSGNLPPIANLDADVTDGVAPLLVSFDAGGSYDPDNDVPPSRGITLFEWDWNYDGIYEESGASATVQHTFDLPSMSGYMVVVRVTDSEGATATDDIVIQVTSGGTPPTIVSVSPLSGTEGTQVTISANVTGTQPYDYFFDFDSLGASWATPNYVEASGSTVEAVVTLGAPGIYTLTVHASNSAGTHEQDYQFEILSSGVPPVIESISPGSGTEGTEVTIVATVSGTPPFDYSFDMTEPAIWATPDFVEGSGTAVEASATLANAPGIYMLTVNVSNAYGSDSRMEAFVINSASAEWNIYPVDSANSPADSSLAIINGNPAIAYFGNGKELFYAYCGTADGTGSWSSVTVDAKGMGLGDVGSYCSLVETGGGPSISYYDGDMNYDLKFAHNANAGGSGTWGKYTIDSAGDAGWLTSIENVNGYPAIGYYSDNTTIDYRFAVCDTDDGSGNWPAASVATVGTPIFADGRVLRVLDSRPAVAFYNWMDSALQFSINSDTDGGGTWSTSVVDNSGIILFPSMNAINSGYPAIAYRNWDASVLQLAVNSAADGTGAWNIYPVDYTSAQQFISLANIGGYPAIAYLDDNTDTLYYSICSTADGSGTWGITEVDSGGTIGYVNLLEVDGRACVTYAEVTTGVLNFARRNW
jgi:PKD repeat protein